MSKIPIDEALLLSLRRTGLSCQQLAARLGTSPNTILRRLRVLDQPTGKTLPVAVEDAVRLYRAGWSTKRIGAQQGVSQQTIVRRLRAAGEHIRQRSEWSVPGRAPVPVDLERLHALAAERRSTREIAAILGVSEETIRDRMVRDGLPRLPAKARPERNVFWRGGRVVDKHGYILVKSLDHPRRTAAGYVREHRLVMERVLGRYLLPTEVVDHIDGNPANNDPANLRVFASNREHLAATLRGRVPHWTPEGRERMRARHQRTPALPDASLLASGTDGHESP